MLETVQGAGPGEELGNNIGSVPALSELTGKIYSQTLSKRLNPFW